MSFITDVRASELESLRDLDTDQRAQLLDDAARVKAYVRRNEQISEPDLRAYGERNDLGPDRLNQAIAFLEETGQLLKLPDTPVLPAEPVEQPAAKRANSKRKKGS